MRRLGPVRARDTQIERVVDDVELLEQLANEPPQPLPEIVLSHPRQPGLARSDQRRRSSTSSARCRPLRPATVFA
jgi:hypothetical protein